MLILALDTSSIACSVAVCDETKLHGEIYTDIKLKHSEKLMVMLDSLLSRLCLDINDIDAFAPTTGPGSFTGLRIGAASAKGLAQAQSKPVYCVSTLLSLAYGGLGFSGILCPILDAQRDMVYTAQYISDNSDSAVIRQIESPAQRHIEELIDLLRAKNERVRFSGDGVIKYREQLASSGLSYEIAPRFALNNRASFCAEAVFSLINNEAITPTEYDQITIDYLRDSDAKINYQVKL